MFLRVPYFIKLYLSYSILFCHNLLNLASAIFCEVWGMTVRSPLLNPLSGTVSLVS